MRLLETEAIISDLDSFIMAVDGVADETDTTVQASDTRYVVNREHLERAAKLTGRAIARGNKIVHDRAVEILLHASGRRQINRAFKIDVSERTLPVVVLIDGGDEAAAEAALFDRLNFEPAETFGDYDESLIRNVFSVGEARLHVADDDLPALVRERVALLAIDR